MTEIYRSTGEIYHIALFFIPLSLRTFASSNPNQNILLHFMNRIITLIVAALVCCLPLGCGNYDDDISRLDGLMSEVNTSIGGLENSDKELQGVIASLQTQAADLGSSIEELNKRLDGAGGDGDKLRQELEAAKSDLEARLEELNSSIEALRKKDEEILSRIESLKKEMTGEVTEETAAAVKAEIEKLDASIKEYLASTLAAYYTKDEIAEILKGLCTKEEVTALLKGYYTKDEIDALLVSIAYESEYSAGTVGARFKSEGGKYVAENIRMKFNTSYSKELKDAVTSVAGAEVVYYDGENGAATGATSSLEAVGLEYSGSSFTITLSPGKLADSFFRGETSAVLKLSLSVNGRKVPVGRFRMVPVDIAPDVRTIWVGDVSFRMIKVERGSFTMGGAGTLSDDTTPHKVTITKDYWIGETEVTQKLFLALMGDMIVNGLPITEYWPEYERGDYFPVYGLTYLASMEFVKKLNQVTGKFFRLPTEAEWEFAARGGNKSMGYDFSGSDNVRDVSWLTSESPAFLHSVGGRRPNELGLYDMSGNATEWCSDWYAPYGTEDQVDPAGPASGTEKVCRGPRFQSVDFEDFLVIARNHCPPDNCPMGSGGLRLVLPVE